LLLGIALPAGALAETPAPPAPRGDSKRVVPTRIHDRAQAEGEVRVIVELALPSSRRTESMLSAQARFAYRQEIADTAARVLARLAKHPHQVFRRYQTAPLIAIGAGPGALRELEASGVMVRRVIEDRIHKPVLMDSVPLIGADQAWAQGYDGTGTVVAVIDSGVDSAHALLAGKVVEEACYSTTSGSQSTTLCPNGAQEQIGPGAAAPCPLEAQGCWHGTHVAGIVAGNGTPADLPIWGVGKGANLIAIQVFSQINRFLDCGGQPPCLGAYTSDILAALERVYTLRTTYPIAAVNMSLGAELFSATCDDQEYKPFIDNLRSAGIATVVASGNDGSTSEISAPACVSTAVSVGATTKTDQVADFSNVAPFLSLFAPGDEIISSYPGDQFAVASGTSMASPHVAGAWAILKQAKPSATVDEVLQALTDTGVMITDTRAGGVTTKPRIQVDLALLALLYPGVPLVGSVTPDRGTVGTSLSVTITGINFESGTTASFGDGVTVTSTTLVSAHELTIGLTIPLTTAIGARDVTLTNPGGQTYTRPGGFTVLPPPPTMSLAFLGKLRDKVGPSPTALGPDTALDGTFRVIVQGGMWPRTVTRLDLRRASGGGRRWRRVLHVRVGPDSDAVHDRVDVHADRQLRRRDLGQHEPEPPDPSGDLQRVAEHRGARRQPDGLGDRNELPVGRDRVVRHRYHRELHDLRLVDPAVGRPHDRNHGHARRARRDGREWGRPGRHQERRLHDRAAATDGHARVPGQVAGQGRTEPHGVRSRRRTRRDVPGDGPGWDLAAHGDEARPAPDERRRYLGYRSGDLLLGARDHDQPGRRAGERRQRHREPSRRRRRRLLRVRVRSEPDAVQ
jgi:subtilisin family serine protease